MKFAFESLSEDMRYKLMLATVLPRPIAWVTSLDSNGLVNAAPFHLPCVIVSDRSTATAENGNVAGTLFAQLMHDLGKEFDVSAVRRAEVAAGSFSVMPPLRVSARMSLFGALSMSSSTEPFDVTRRMGVDGALCSRTLMLLLLVSALHSPPMLSA